MLTISKILNEGEESITALLNNNETVLFNKVYEIDKKHMSTYYLLESECMIYKATGVFDFPSGQLEEIFEIQRND